MEWRVQTVSVSSEDQTADLIDVDDGKEEIHENRPELSETSYNYRNSRIVVVRQELLPLATTLITDLIGEMRSAQSYEASDYFNIFSEYILWEKKHLSYLPQHQESLRAADYTIIRECIGETGAAVDELIAVR